MTEICNTHGQLVAAGGGIAIMPAYVGTRTEYRSGWKVYRVDAAGARIATDPTAHWTDYGCKRFHESDKTRAEALEEAKRWCAETYGEQGPWVRNRMGDYLPARIHKAYPLRKRTKVGGGA